MATAAAREAIRRLSADRGPLMFFQSGGCCDGSLPICLDAGELIIGGDDVLLGEIEGAPVYIAGGQHEAWKHTQLVLDVDEGEPEGFSIAAGEGRHFSLLSRCLPAPVDPPGRPRK